MSDTRRPVVALVSDAIYPYFRGGKELRYREVADRLARRAEVHVFTMKWWAGPTVRQDGGVTFHAVSRLYAMYSGERRSYREALLFALSCLRLLWFRFDVLEADQFPNFHILTLRLVTWLKRKPLYVTWHEVWGREYWREYLGVAGNMAWLVEWLSMRAPDHLFAASPQTADRLREILGDSTPITVAPNGIDLASIQSCWPHPERVDIVTVGRFLPHKNIDMLLESVAMLRSTGVEVTCRIIGDGPQRENLYERASRLGIQSAIDFRYDVWEQKDVYGLIKAARVAVFPTSREGFGIAVLEALACGVPVVTTSAPDNLARHLVDRSAAGVVCAPSAAAIAEALRPILEKSRDETAAEPVAPEPWLAEYGWDAVTDQIARVFGA